jgi:hypothetical protein
MSHPPKENSRVARSDKKEFAGTWRLLNAAAVIASTIAARQATQLTWRMIAGRRGPESAQHPDVSARRAFVFAAVSGAAAAVARLAVRRGLAVYWTKSTGDLPPGVKPLGEPKA